MNFISGTLTDYVLLRYGSGEYDNENEDLRGYVSKSLSGVLGNQSIQDRPVSDCGSYAERWPKK